MHVLLHWYFGRIWPLLVSLLAGWLGSYHWSPFYGGLLMLQLRVILLVLFCAEGSPAVRHTP
jgi:hypothetical protein